MSAIINGLGKYLSATLSTAPLETENRLVAIWTNRPSSGFEALGSANTIFDLRDSGGTVYNMGRCNSTPSYIGSGANGSGTLGAAPAALVQDSWVLAGTYIPLNTGSGNSTLKQYYNGAGATVSVTNTATSARSMTGLWIGRTYNDGSSRWRGYVAEIAIFKPTDTANADAIMADLALYTANTIASGSPIYYAKMLSSVVATVGGVDLTNNGTTTFDASHPSITDYSASSPGLLFGNYYRN